MRNICKTKLVTKCVLLIKQVKYILHKESRSKMLNGNLLIQFFLSEVIR